MNVQPILAFMAAPARVTARTALGSALSCSVLAGTHLAAADAIDPVPVEPTKLGEPSGARVTADRNGSIPTKDGLTLRLTTDLGSVRIVTLPPGALPVVRYTVHLETDARASLAQRLLDRYSLVTQSSEAGVEINGSLPPQIARSSAAGVQFWVQFEIAVPHGYSVEVKTEAGDIETQDIGGIANLSTQGGNIHAGRVGLNFARD